ncbi:phosphate acyltransferase PlsX [Oceanotoga sp. DSM 15011]|jgi:glycerol-3-phosphate acyltransferase PlsX|uniref:Phosphate acyltransferase n=1 Tax=Oceanotoga teriensis TaxID=515440 RepID=A0AA45C8G3_9BACT|nr:MULTISPECIES: phosphate acyltransferase PlsX [Oceanotoga]MDN5342443.1 phosphate acyltransferase [Oceanotoga sp.]MDO7975604.1 phosphate acyltransferase PlsX [Oceanotoga teriensis]PWJ96107.1 phosphate:acyl-[acyl carrier protein] acyltransferase [Oceanotoga teriensis]UYO99889.1 phosphate acyltransferase PlsX [Oceanotoga sp. DSM 15011]
MSKIRIGLDLYGGDNAPESTIQGAIFAFENKFLEDAELVIVGETTEEDKKKLQKYNVSYLEGKNLVDNTTKPTQILKLKESSIYIGCQNMKNSNLNAFVSAGNTGALLTAGTFVAGRLKGIKRPALALALPGKNGKPRILVDAGANAEVKAEHYFDFAREGIAYAKFLGIENPRVGIINIGTEEEKGPQLVKEAAEVLKENNINYIGFVEAREIFDDRFDVLLTDGFTGNNILKTIEGTAYYILNELKSSIKSGGLFTKLGALMMKGSLYSLKGKIDYRQYGGTFFLGVNGHLVKAHGSSDSEAIANALYVAYKASKEDLLSNILI